MLRKIIKIDIDKCIGCGLCAAACHEGAIGMIDGKAKLLRDDYCDGLGDCLPACPTNAITFEEREALSYNHEEVQSVIVKNQSRLGQWPIQIKLLPIQAPYFKDANLLIAADCTAFAYGNLHNRFIKDRITMIGCPKLDAVDYSKKLAEICRNNDIKSITVVRMEVPCCGGISYAVTQAIEKSGKNIPYQVFTVTIDGVIDER